MASESLKEPPVEASPISVELQSLASLPVLSSSAIHPHLSHNQPIRVFPTEEQASTAVEVMLHCTANKPHPYVVVFVAMVTNRSTLPLTNLLLRFGVEKVGASHSPFAVLKLYLQRS